MTPGFTGNLLDRVDHLRDDPAAIAAFAAAPEARLLLLDGLDPLVDASGRLIWVPLDRAPAEPPLILLGLENGQPRFATPDQLDTGGHTSPGARELVSALPPGEAGSYAAARSLVDWHRRHGFCAACGAATRLVKAGWARACDGCSAQHFPRTDPVVIMLAEHEDHVLLGRQPHFPPGRYSALAGFVEPGESIEEAVARELQEEAGVLVAPGAVRYLASQPWPFPSNLMIACIARTENRAINLDSNELEDAFWCHRDAVRAALAGEAGARFDPAPPYAIAHTLLSRWVAGD